MNQFKVCLFPVLYAAYKECASHIFSTSDVRLGKPRMPRQLPGFQHGRKADWIGNWK